MKISSKIDGTTETYTVTYWYTDCDGFLKQARKDVYCNSKSAHKQIEAYVRKQNRSDKSFKIISVVYN